MSAPILAKNLKDGSRCLVTIEPDGETGWNLRVERGDNLVGVTKARPYELPREKRQKGLSFGADSDSGYVYYAEVREATLEEAAPVLMQEEKQQLWERRRARINAEIVAPATRPAEDEIPDLLTLPEIQFGEPLTHLRVDQVNGTVWVLHFNGYDGDNWSYNNYRSYVTAKVELTPARAELLTALTGPAE